MRSAVTFGNREPKGEAMNEYSSPLSRCRRLPPPSARVGRRRYRHYLQGRCLDPRPAIGYDWHWSIIKSLFDGPADYKPGTTELFPDLAESYEITNDGKTFTFKLRPREVHQ